LPCFFFFFARQSAQQHCEGGCNSCPKASINGLEEDADDNADVVVDVDVNVDVDVDVDVARLSEMPLGNCRVQHAAC